MCIVRPIDYVKHRFQKSLDDPCKQLMTLVIYCHSNLLICSRLRPNFSWACQGYRGMGRSWLRRKQRRLLTQVEIHLERHIPWLHWGAIGHTKKDEQRQRNLPRLCSDYWVRNQGAHRAVRRPIPSQRGCTRWQVRRSPIRMARPYFQWAYRLRRHFDWLRSPYHTGAIPFIRGRNRSASEVEDPWSDS